MNDAADTGDEVVRPSTIIRRIIGSSRLAGFVERRDGPGIAFAAAHTVLLVATGWVLWRALGTAWAVPATIAHGIVNRGICSPRFTSPPTTPRSAPRGLNTAAGWITGLVLMLPPMVFRYEHTAHHRYTQDVEREIPQMIPMGEHRRGFWYYASAVPYFRGMLSGLLRHPFGRLNPSELCTMSRRRCTAPCSTSRGSSGASIWRSPRCPSNSSRGSWCSSGCCRGSRASRSCASSGCRSTWAARGFRACWRIPAPSSRPRRLRLLAWNMAYHTAHHALPQAPFFRLAALDAVLRDHVAETREGYVDFVRTHFLRMAQVAASPGGSVHERSRFDGRARRGGSRDACGAQGRCGGEDVPPARARALHARHVLPRGRPWPRDTAIPWRTRSSSTSWHASSGSPISDSRTSTTSRR